MLFLLRSLISITHPCRNIIYCLRTVVSDIRNYKFASTMSFEEKDNLKKWLEEYRSQGGALPHTILEDQMARLFEENSELARISYIRFLLIKEAREKSDAIRKELKKLKRKDIYREKQKQPQDHIVYGLWKNSLFAKTTQTHVKNYYNYRLARAITHGQPLVIDLGFDDKMHGREISSYAEQLQMSISINRCNSDPFNMTFCNVNFISDSFLTFIKRKPSFVDPQFPMNITSKSYLEVFAKEKLIYLTPNADDIMTEFDHEAIYIIGGIVDLRHQLPLTAEKARNENIKTLKLPLKELLAIKILYQMSHLDEYKYKNGKIACERLYGRLEGFGRLKLPRYNICTAKAKAIHIIVAFLLDLKNYGDWNKALKNIPKRMHKRRD